MFRWGPKWKVFRCGPKWRQEWLTGEVTEETKHHQLAREILKDARDPEPGDCADAVKMLEEAAETGDFEALRSLQPVEGLCRSLLARRREAIASLSERASWAVARGDVDGAHEINIEARELGAEFVASEGEAQSVWQAIFSDDIEDEARSEVNTVCREDELLLLDDHTGEKVPVTSFEQCAVGFWKAREPAPSAYEEFVWESRSWHGRTVEWMRKTGRRKWEERGLSPEEEEVLERLLPYGLGYYQLEVKEDPATDPGRDEEEDWDE